MDRFKGLQRIDLKGINMPCFLNVWPNDCSLALKNRLLQIMARSAPGAALAGMASSSARREDWPGCLDGYGAVIETSHPHLVSIRDRAAIGIRVTIMAHNREQRGVVIEEDVAIGTGAIILPNVK